MSQLDDIFDEVTATFGSSSIEVADRKARAKKQTVALIYTLTEPEYSDAFNSGDTETYELMVRVRTRAKEL